MRYTRKDDLYMISRITRSRNNILGICFSENNSSDTEVIQWDIKEYEKIITSEEEILKQVLSGLKSVNNSLGTNYKISKIYYLPSESAGYFAYNFLTTELIRHYHIGGKFE